MVDLKGAEKYGLYGISRETHGDGDACLDADEDILESFDAIQLVLGQTDDRGLGKLVITDGYVFKWRDSMRREFQSHFLSLFCFLTLGFVEVGLLGYWDHLCIWSYRFD